MVTTRNTKIVKENHIDKGKYTVKVYHRYLPKTVKGGSGSKESVCNAVDLGLIPGLGRYPGGGHGNPLQHSYLENSWTESLVGYTVKGYTRKLHVKYDVKSVIVREGE